MGHQVRKGNQLDIVRQAVIIGRVVTGCAWVLLQAMGVLRSQLVLAGQEHANGENAELAGILNSVCAAFKSSPNIAEKVRK